MVRVWLFTPSDRTRGGEGRSLVLLLSIEGQSAGAPAAS
jgi:hypothetical protein